MLIFSGTEDTICWSVVINMETCFIVLYVLTLLCSVYDFNVLVYVADKGNGGQPACPEEWKKCKEEHE